MHQKAKARFQQQLARAQAEGTDLVGFGTGSAGGVGGIRVVGGADTRTGRTGEELDLDEREQEKQDIIDRIMQLEQAAMESRRSGRAGGIPDHVTLQQHQQFSRDSDSQRLILELG